MAALAYVQRQPMTAMRTTAKKGSTASPTLYPSEATAMARPRSLSKYRAMLVIEICDANPCPDCRKRNMATTSMTGPDARDIQAQATSRPNATAIE
ncbi:MAG TPA: hypothetical protein DIC24_07035 [Gammaproteobacteria bacterium]|nr:hypothetical protein [Gammaproteobacteria bacterium]